MRRVGVLLVLSASLFARSYAAQQGAAPPPSTIDFVRDVQPILQDHCYECHGADKQMNGFRLDRRHDAMRGGTLAVITPGSAASSRLYLRLVGTTYGRRMPLESEPLAPTQADTIKRWIDQGAPWPDQASGDVPAPPLDPAAVKAFDALRGGNRAAFLAAVADRQDI